MARLHAHPEVQHHVEPMLEAHRELKLFLRKHLYRHYRVHRMSIKARRIVQELFAAFMEDERILPPDYQQKLRCLRELEGEQGAARAIADYIAGMTDRFAIGEYDRIFAPAKLT